MKKTSTQASVDGGPEADPTEEDRAGRSVGLLCNCTLDEDPKEQLSASLINRAFLIDQRLAPLGIQTFLYSPKDVIETGEVTGYRVRGWELVAETRRVPRINANWTYGTRRLIDRGMGYRAFKRWTREHGIEVFVPYAFSELVSNKRRAYEVVAGYDPHLHPHTEDWRSAPAQLLRFLERSSLVFIKPRAGNRGNRIFVLRGRGDGCSLKYYDDRSRREFANLTLEAALGVIDVAAGEQRYVIQEGVDSLRFEGSVFDVRVVMVSDGSRWHSLLETRLAPADSDLSNVYQGGSSRVAEDLFESLFGAEQGRAMKDEVERVSHGLAEHLDTLHPGRVMELGFDFVLDAGRRLHLVEVNAKPGVVGFGSEHKIFDWKPADEPHYETSVRPHVRHLADFLRSKLEGA